MFVQIFTFCSLGPCSLLLLCFCLCYKCMFLKFPSDLGRIRFEIHVPNSFWFEVVCSVSLLCLNKNKRTNLNFLSNTAWFVVSSGLKACFVSPTKSVIWFKENYLRNVVVLHWFLPWFIYGFSNSCLIAEECICMPLYILSWSTSLNWNASIFHVSLTEQSVKDVWKTHTLGERAF